jgi:hypothetical protein
MKSDVIAGLPTLADRGRCAPPKPSRLDRLDARIDKKRDYERKAETFRRDVIKRDGHVCRCCGGKVIRTLDLVPNRLEVNHIHGRVGVFRFLVQCALVLCFRCHERVTGTVNHKLKIVGTAFVTVDGRQCINAGETQPIPVHFEEAA